MFLVDIKETHDEKLYKILHPIFRVVVLPCESLLQGSPQNRERGKWFSLWNLVEVAIMDTVRMPTRIKIIGLLRSYYFVLLSKSI